MRLSGQLLVLLFDGAAEFWAAFATKALLLVLLTALRFQFFLLAHSLTVAPIRKVLGIPGLSPAGLLDTAYFSLARLDTEVKKLV